MKVLFVSYEVAPFAVVGGLGEVAGSLPRALAERGVEIAVAMPLHRSCRQHLPLPVEVERLDVPVGQRLFGAEVLRGSLGEHVPVFFIRYDPYFDRPDVYGEGGGDYPDAGKRAAFFCWAVQVLPQAVGFPADVVHCNDWPTGLLPVLTSQAPSSPATVYTIHNLAYQGRFPLAAAAEMGLADNPAVVRTLTHGGQLNFMTGGIRAATVISTVSERYAREIQTKVFGDGLENLLLARSDDLFGIRNGIDVSQWNPATDPALPANYSADDPSGKSRCKRALQEELGLAVEADVPVVGVVSRMVWQKGLDLLAEVIPQTLDWPMQYAVLGRGEPALEERFRALAAARPDRVAVRIGFDPGLAHRIFAGADLFAMPSRYEPCGSGQMMALCYGTVPVVSWTGGLAETVTEDMPDRNGFVFGDLDVTGLRNALGRANAAYHDRAGWAALVEANLRRSPAQFSWDESARRYVELYEIACERHRCSP